MIRIKQKILEPSKIYTNTDFKLKILILYTRAVKQVHFMTVKRFNNVLVNEVAHQPVKYTLEELTSLTLETVNVMNLENMKGVN